MNHTTNYNLPQWEDTDAVKREDVNGAMSSIDSAIEAAAATGGGNCYIKKLDYYVGTGQSGPNHPTVIEFPKRPFLFVILGVDTLVLGWIARPQVLWYNGSTTVIARDFTHTWNGNTLSFYNSSAGLQANLSGVTYHVFALFDGPVD